MSASMTNAFGDLLRRAQDAIANLMNAENLFLGRKGEIIYSKNNVCVHDNCGQAQTTTQSGDEDGIIHTPGYLTVRCQGCEEFGVTLVLQWLPNTTLQRNPARAELSSNAYNNHARIIDILGFSIRCISPHRLKSDSIDGKQGASKQSELTSNDDKIRRNCNLDGKRPDASIDNQNDLDISMIHVLENTAAINHYRTSCETIINTIPEQFAKAHNLMMDSASLAQTANNSNGTYNAVYTAQSTNLSSEPSPLTRPLFSVNLGKMRSMRIFYSNSECSSGQLVIASPDSHYKILHFHHGGLDRLAKLFGDWNAIKTKSVTEGSFSPVSDHHLLIFHPEVGHNELDPEDGLYRRVDAEFWRSYCNADGSIDDPFTIRKAIYFASMDAALRHEIWPFLLGVHNWRASLAQRAVAGDERLAAYRILTEKCVQKFGGVKLTVADAMSHNNSTVRLNMLAVANTIAKDVVRTDRRNSFFAGDDNENLEMMNSILLNYAVAEPSVGYVQGMSDLVAPLLSTIRDEPLTYFCFSNLMRQTLFAAHNSHVATLMNVNLAYLRELLRLLAPQFHGYLTEIGGDAPQLMFVHRWILLFFKREFPEDDALHIWEACWAKYRTSYFHLFICTAIVVIYGADIIAQRLPHDEILLYFSSLTMHMDADVILKKVGFAILQARGLLHQFYRLPRLPCTLGGLCERSDATNEQWSSHGRPHIFDCVQSHDSDSICPYSLPEP